MPKRRSLEYHISLDVTVRNAKRLVANVRQNYARNPTCFDADGNALPPEEAIEDALDGITITAKQVTDEPVTITTMAATPIQKPRSLKNSACKTIVLPFAGVLPFVGPLTACQLARRCRPPTPGSGRPGRG